MISPGTLIAERYAVTRLLGEGGMGSVYEAKHLQIGKKVAIKFLSDEFSSDPKAVLRFLQEAKIAGTLGHLNICGVMDFGVTKEQVPYLVMEYLEGTSLARLLSMRSRISVEEALGIIIQVLDALEEVHGRGIIHRDLKPENIFITEVKGHGTVVKILDFGISKITTADGESLHLTGTGGVIGTACYMSPEQARGRGKVDLRTDLYACGVILFEMVTGRVPFDGEKFNEVFASILEDPVPDPRTLVPDLPDRLAELMVWCLEKKPEKRPQSSSQLKAALKQFQQDSAEKKLMDAAPQRAGSAVEAPTSPYRRPARKKAAITAFALAALTVAAAILVWYTFTVVAGREKGSGGAEAMAALTDLSRPMGEVTGAALAAMPDAPGDSAEKQAGPGSLEDSGQSEAAEKPAGKKYKAKKKKTAGEGAKKKPGFDFEGYKTQ